MACWPACQAYSPCLLLTCVLLSKEKQPQGPDQAAIHSLGRFNLKQMVLQVQHMQTPASEQMATTPPLRPSEWVGCWSSLGACGIRAQQL
jgi:hypothetical protein